MEKWYSIVFAFLCVFIPQMSSAGTGPGGDLDGFEGCFVMAGESVQRAQLFFVQNDTKKKPESAGKTDEEGTDGKTFKKEKDDTRKTKQLKPFIPSETIPADQGVDFPYDI